MMEKNIATEKAVNRRGVHREWTTDPLPGSWGLSIAPITESVARVALSGSDSNHLSKMWIREGGLVLI